MSEPSSPANLEWLDRLPLPAVIIREARFVYVNDAFLTLLALKREQAVGMRFDERVAPEDARRIAERHQQRLRGEVVPDSYEFDVIRGDGERRTVEIFVSQAGADTLFQLHDVTGRVARHENLRALARLGAAVQREQTEEAIFRAVGKGLVALGGALVRMVPDGEEVSVAAVFSPVSPDAPGSPPIGTRRPWSPGLKQAWAEGYAFLDDLKGSTTLFFGGAHELVLRRFDEHRWLRGAMIRIDELGKPREVLLVMAGWVRPEDQPTLALFGAQISAALDAASAQAKLVQRERLAALGEMAAALAHEVRNPLGVIFNSLSSLKRVLGPGTEASGVLEIMREESERINHLVGDLLEFSRPSQPSLSDERPLPAALQEAVGSALAAAPSIRFELHAAADLGAVSMDARLMRQVFLNLAHNAVQAMPEGGLLKVGAQREGSLVRVSFEDSGEGIAPGSLARIFEPFFTTRARGTGLGLALVKRIVEGHRGQVRVTSELGRGTRVLLEWRADLIHESTPRP